MIFSNPDSGDATLDWCDEHESFPAPSQVAAEYFPHAQLNPEAAAWLRSQGVPETALDGVAELRSGYVFDGHGEQRFVIDPPAGERTGAVGVFFHVPVMRDGQLVDLVRFSRERPALHRLQWGGRVCRRATWLGEPEAAGDGAWPNPTHVWHTALAWLKAGRKGLVYLRVSKPWFRFGLLRQLQAVMGEDTAHTLELEKVAWEKWRPSLKGRPKRWGRIDPHNAAKHVAKVVEDELVRTRRP